MTAWFTTHVHPCEHDFGPELLPDTMCLRECGTAYAEWSDENAHVADVQPLPLHFPAREEEPPELSSGEIPLRIEQH